MKIQIDTTAKTIKLESCEKLSALFDFLTSFFPNGEWEDYTLQTNTTIVNWGNPIIVRPTPIWVNPYTYTDISGTAVCKSAFTVSESNGITYTATNGNCVLTASASNSVINVELN